LVAAAAKTNKVTICRGAHETDLVLMRTTGRILSDSVAYLAVRDQGQWHAAANLARTASTPDKIED
jgi:hypothetical protein